MELTGGETQSLIPRPNKQVKVTYGEHQISCNYNNTAIFEFGKAYEHINHLYIKKAIGEQALWLFGESPLLDTLKEAEFPRVFKPYPTDGDLESYMQYQGQQLEEDIDNFGENDGNS